MTPQPESPPVSKQLYDALGYLDWLEWCGGHAKSAREAAEHFGVKPRTILRWRARLRDEGLLK
jgi:DNA-binding transcriptional regulator YhcF (GntR family)